MVPTVIEVDHAVMETTAERDGTRWVEHRCHRVWAGITSNDAGGGIPLLLVHGGPGIPHDYLLPFEELADERPVVFYDQYGCGRSDRAEDPSTYDIELFVDELATVRDQLGLARVHLLAHSYGGPLALQYLLDHPDSGVVSLTLSNSFGSLAGLVEGWHRRLLELGPAGEVLGTGDPASQAWQDALGEFIQAFIIPGVPPDLLMAAQTAMGGEVYATMHGASWFAADGKWSSWSAMDRLDEVTVPVLAVSGTRDQCVPELSGAIADGVRDGEAVILDAGHLPFLEVQAAYFPVVREFLRRAE